MRISNVFVSLKSRHEIKKEERSMNKKKLLLTLTGCLLAIAMLAACAGGGGPAAPETPPPAAQGQAPAAQEGQGAATTDDFDINVFASEVVRGAVNQQAYPLVSDRVTLTFWWPFAGQMGETSDLNDTDFWQWYEELTNVSIEWIIPPAGGDRDAFNLLFAAGDIPDILQTSPVGNGHTYRGGEDRALEDGWFVNMRDWMWAAPNYWSWIVHEADSGFQSAVFSDLGNIYGFWGIWKPMYDEVMPELGMAIRQDFLNLVGMDVPTTYDEWEAVLIAFRDELGIEAPLYSSRYGTFGDNGEFIAGFETAPWFYRRDGVVRFGPLDDGFRDYLALMNRWYDMGLLDRDFPTRQSSGVTADNDMILNDRVGAHLDWATRMSATYVARGNPNQDLFLVAAPQPMQTANGPIPRFRAETGCDGMTGNVFLIGGNSNHVETAVRWLDGFYAQEIMWNANFGLPHREGTVWHYLPDGRRIGDYEFRFNNPGGLSPASVINEFWTRNPPVRVESAQYEQAPENNRLAYRVWGEFSADWVMPRRITMTPEESARFASIFSDIETFVQEHNVRFITGSLSLDTYDSYRDTLRSMGIYEAIAIQQAALDRYMQRGR